MTRLAIIGGTGLTSLKGLEITGREVVHTPYGEPSGPLLSGVLCGTDSAGGVGGECVPLLNPAQVEALIGSGEIHGGMVPKVRSALRALEAGVAQVRITNLQGLGVGGGTCFQAG